MLCAFVRLTFLTSDYAFVKKKILPLNPDKPRYNDIFLFLNKILQRREFFFQDFSFSPALMHFRYVESLCPNQNTSDFVDFNDDIPFYTYSM